MIKFLVTVLAAVLVTPGLANAWEFRTRLIQRVGNQDLPISSGVLDLVHPGPYHIRLQLGVFDDAAGPAPTGGVLGWNLGAITYHGVPNPAQIELRRNPGRLAPFNFAPGPFANGNPPLPAGDPFFSLTNIDATLGTQSPVWVCDASGNAPPQPQPVIRGLNTFVSVYAFSVEAHSYVVGGLSVSGNLIAASHWSTVGTPNPPDCSDPDDPLPGSVTYAPFPTTPVPFTASLLIIPGPAAASLLVFAGLQAARRRRSM